MQWKVIYCCLTYFLKRFFWEKASKAIEMHFSRLKTRKNANFTRPSSACLHKNSKNSWFWKPRFSTSKSILLRKLEKPELKSMRAK